MTAQRDVLLSLTVKPDVAAGQAALGNIASGARAAEVQVGRLRDAMGSVRIPAGDAFPTDAGRKWGQGAGFPRPAGGDGASAMPALDKAQKDFNDNLDKMRDQMVKLNVAMNPENLRRSVAATAELQRAQEQYAAAVKREKARQEGGAMGAAGDAIGGPLGGILQAIGRRVQGIVGLFSGNGDVKLNAPAVPKFLQGFVGGDGASTPPPFGRAGGGQGGFGVGPEGGGLGGVGGGAEAAGSALSKLAVAAGVVIGSFHAVSLASPATTARLERAISDTTAVFGERLVPVFEFGVEVVRAFGDIFENILPSSKDVQGVMDQFRPVLRTIKDAFIDIGPIIKGVLVVGLNAAGAALKLLLIPIKLVAEGLSKLGHFFGIAPAPEDRKSSVGKAIQQVEIVGNIEDLSNKLIQTALAAGLAGQKTIAEKQLDELIEIKKNTARQKEIENATGAGGRGFFGETAAFFQHPIDYFTKAGPEETAAGHRIADSIKSFTDKMLEDG